MNSLGLSEIVKKETLSLYRCSDGHQMWLTKEEEKNKPDLLVKENIIINIDKTIEKPSSPSISTEDQELTVVMFPFTETRYKRDGTVERYRFNERHYIRGGKVYGVRKWSQEE